MRMCAIDIGRRGKKRDVLWRKCADDIQGTIQVLDSLLSVRDRFFDPHYAGEVNHSPVFGDELIHQSTIEDYPLMQWVFLC